MNNMNIQKEKQEQWCITDLFYMTKSYEQILEDHVLIKKIKFTLEKAGMSRYTDGCTFEDLIKEAYFQCGIICKPICTSFGDYKQFFIKRERKFFKEYDYLNKKTVACIVHLLLSTRKEIPEGVGGVVDSISECLCNWTTLGRLPQNPFVNLLNPERHKHEIDFGVRAKSLSNIYLWSKVNWYDLGLDDSPNISDIEKGFDTPENYCRRLANSINCIMECLDIKDEEEQLDLLDIIGKTIHDNIGCTYDDCEFYNDRPNKCKCDENYLALEPVYFNPLRAKVIEELKENVVTKFRAKNKYKNKKGILDETQKEDYIIIDLKTKKLYPMEDLNLESLNVKINVEVEHEKNMEKPLRNRIFQDRIFDTNEYLSRLRNVIASAIDMGDATSLYGKPQEVRINPNAQNEWYYIVKAIEEAGITKKFAITHFIEQMMEWFPILFPSSSKEEWEKFKRRLSKSISEEKSLWKHGKMKDVIPLKDMWAKQKQIALDSVKMERIYAIAYKGLYQNLVDLKDKIAKEKSR